MKTRFNNKELCHVWAQQTQEIGKGSSMFFEGPSIYSYGHHFEIARFVKDQVILFNPRKYSNTTAKHKLYVSRAIPSGYRVFTVPYFTGTGLTIDNIHYFTNEIKSTLEDASRSWKYKEMHLRDAQRQISDMIDYMTEFNISDTETTLEYKRMDLLSPEVMIKLQEEDKARKAKELIKRKKDIAEWLTGEINSISGLSEIFLRAKNEEVETTLGAKVPISTAKVLFNMIKAGKPPVHGFQIGHYTVNGYSDGILTVGCHRLKDQEINRFASTMGWC